ncbi:MAG: metallo-mystery pair system four-Cys motif protein [Gemmatimonadetes bacterium]|nr:metallo-mystery pair system four-Cys motif protein [Gemmatimonadota bacterium]
MISFLRTTSVLATAVLPAVLAAQSAATTPVRLAMRATVGDAPFACGRSYAGIGKASSTIQATEFKFYVHDVQLTTRDGRTVPVTLTQDGLWQHGSVALLDFEDGSGACSNGNADIHDVIEGTVPAGEYTGVRFTLGVPFDRNHLDLTAQPSPLSLTRMFWAWNSGYKFLRLDLKPEGAQNWVVHLGSTECTPTGSATTMPTACRWANRATVSLDGFNPMQDAIRFDVAALLQAADVSTNQPKTAAGCMSGQNDGDCVAVFDALGLPFGPSKGGTQRVFGVARGALAAPDGAAR